LKFGKRGGKFQVVNLPGYGISRNISAVFDCFNLGLAERGATVKVNDKSIGRITALIEDATNDEKFTPFYEQLDNYYSSLSLSGVREGTTADNGGDEVVEVDS
jgi:hypothetical protein